MHEGATLLAFEHLLERTLGIHIEDDDGEFVLLAEGKGGKVHNFKALAINLIKGYGVELGCSGVLLGVGRIDTIHTSTFEEHLGLNLHTAQCRGTIGREIGVGGTTTDDYHIARFEIFECFGFGEILANGLHTDGGEDFGLHANALQVAMECQRVDDGCKHTHLVALHTVETTTYTLQATEDVATADNDTNLHTALYGVFNLLCITVEHLGRKTFAAIATKRLSAEFQKDSFVFHILLCCCLSEVLRWRDDIPHQYWLRIYNFFPKYPKLGLISGSHCRRQTIFNFQLSIFNFIRYICAIVAKCAVRNSEYKYLNRISSPTDLKALGLSELPLYCEELRDYIVKCCATNPGHLSSSLGAVELSVAIHYVFDFPTDKVVWDVGHQAYAHKIITGRREEFATQRTLGGIAGFPRMEEGDSFGAGHSSVSISAAYGLAEAAAMKGSGESVIAVIGDGAMTGGLAFEGLNNAGASKANILVILNDNRQSIDTNVGALRKHLLRITSSRKYNAMKRKVWGGLRFSPRLRSLLQTAAHSVKRGILRQSNLFESMDFRYFGPTDGHDVESLVRTLLALKNIEGPKLLHAMTIKGKGYAPAEQGDPAVWHSPGKFNPETGEREPSGKGATKYQYVFGAALLELARKDSRVVGVTPAMATGSSMNILQTAMPERVFDVGIAEGHAVTFSAGLAAGGMVPFCAIYSSFMQRAYDNVIHDVALQNLHVVFCLDRAGIVGEDGATHHGEFDVAYMRPIPNLRILAPRNEQELRDAMYTAYVGEGPYVIRYPRGRAAGVDEGEMKPLVEGKSELLREGTDVALLTLGHTALDGAKAAEMAKERGVSVCHIDLRWAKPLDEERLRWVADNFKRIVTVEDGVLNGGIGGAVAEWMLENGYNPQIIRLGIDDVFVEHGSVAELKHLCGYDAEGILGALLN